MPISTSKLSIDQTANGVSLVPGQSMSLTGITAPVDQYVDFNFTTLYASSAATGGQLLSVSNASLAVLQISTSSTATGYGVSVYGTVDGSTWIGPLPYAMVPVGSSYYNTMCQSGDIMNYAGALAKFDVSCLTAIEVRCTAGSAFGFVHGRINLSSASNGLSQTLPLSVDPYRDAGSFSVVKAVTNTASTMFTITNTNNIVSLTRMHLSGISNIATHAIINYKLSRWYNGGSAVLSGGTSTSVSGISRANPLDSFIYPGAAVLNYTVNPTFTGTETIIQQGNVFCPSLANPIAMQPVIVEFGGITAKQVAIRPNYVFALSVTGGTGAADCSIATNVNYMYS